MKLDYVVAVVLVLAGGVLLLGNQSLLNVPRGLVLGAVAAVIAGGMWQAVRPGLEARAAERRAERDRKLALRLRGHMWAIAELTGVDIRDLGMSLYLLRRRPHWWFGGDYLERILRERQLPTVLPTSVTWRPGKGLVGACVRELRPLGRDVGADDVMFHAATRQEWDDGTVPDEVRQGMTYEEFQRITGKYGAIFAVPLLDPTGRTSHVLGCLSLDGPPGSFARLDTDAVHEELAYCAEETYTLLQS